MCHFDNFDIDQIASKLAQRWNFVHSFYCKKISVLDSFDNAKNAKRHPFFGHPIFTAIPMKFHLGLKFLIAFCLPLTGSNEEEVKKSAKDELMTMEGW